MLKLIGIQKTLSFLSPLSVAAATTKPLIPLHIRLNNLHTPPPPPPPPSPPPAPAAPLGTSCNGEDALESPSASLLPPHPWPEWVAFVDDLKSKGYLTQPVTSLSGSGENDGSAGDTMFPHSVYTDMNPLKDACLSFARDRFDIFNSLSTEDIQGVVKNGCPNILRKVVNSAKRLRAYVSLDEADVCSACILRGSCDRAYIICKDSEAVARTVDIMRVILSHALDPSVITGGLKPPFRVQTESSARRLLQEMVELSQSICDAPQVPLESAVKSLKYRTEKREGLKDEMLSQDVDMKRGDWMCPKCNFLNFSKNIRCLKCKEDGPRKVGLQEVGPKKGDWICPGCNFMNFARNIQCLHCKADGPHRLSDNIEMKKGDWKCPQCAFMNFARNSECYKCSEPRPPRELRPGDWECTECDFWNFSRNMVCRKCGSNRPSEAA